MFLTMNTFCKRPFAAILLVFIVGIIVYSNTFRVPFVLDDHPSIIDNPVIRSLENFYANTTGYELLPNRFVAYFSFALNYHIGGLDVTGYHVLNLLIHLATAALVYLLLRLTFQTPFFQDQGKAGSALWSDSQSTGYLPNHIIPILAALLFVVHPVQTQAVTYVVQRMTSLATLFYLLSLVLYVLFRLRLEERTKSGWLKPGLLMFGSGVVAVLAMLTKPISFTLPFAALVYEIFFFRGSFGKRLLYLLPLMLTLPIIPFTVLEGGHAADSSLADSGDLFRVGESISRQDYLLTQFRVIMTYLRLLVFPVNQNLDYEFPIYSTFFTPAVFLSFLILLLLAGLAIYLFWRTRFKGIKQVEEESGSAHSQPLPDPRYLRLVSFGIIWFFLALSVESSFVPIRDVIVEHRLYLPGFGAATVFATLCYLFLQNVKRYWLVAVAGLLIVGLGVGTYQRNHVWGNEIRLWQDVIDKSPDKGRAYNNLGKALEASGRRAEAFAAMTKAIEVDPDYYKAYYNLADLYLVSDQPEKALPLLQSAIRLKPDFTEAYVEIGAALMRSGQFRQVAFFLQKNIDRVGNNPEAHFYLGSAYAFLGNRQAALKELEIVARSDKDLAATLAGILGMRTTHGAPRRQN